MGNAGKDKALEDLLDDSLDGGIVDGAEESMNFNPTGQGMNAQAAGTGYGQNYTETVALRDAPKSKANQKEEAKRKGMGDLGATQRDMLSGLGQDDEPKYKKEKIKVNEYAQRKQNVDDFRNQEREQGFELFDKSVITNPKQKNQAQDMEP